MSDKSDVYTKETAPKAMKVYMDYCAEPIWVAEKGSLEDELPYLNVDIELFPFPPAIMHLLHCFKEAWESAHSSKYIPLEKLSEEFESNESISVAIDVSLLALRSGCEDAVDVWLKKNEWPTKLIRG